MALEDLQRLHNRVITTVGNTSASNNPKQVPHDLSAQVTKGAQAFAAGNTLGLSEEEVLAAVSRQARRQRMRGEDGMTMAEMQGKLQQAQASLAEMSEGEELKGISYREEPEVDPFGQDQGQYAEYQPGDSQYDDQVREKLQDQMDDMTVFDSQGERVYDFGKPLLKTGANPEEFDELDAEKRAMFDEPVRMVKQSALPQDVRYSQQDELQKQRKLSSDVVASERNRRSPSSKLREGYNNVKAAIEAEGLVRSGGQYRGRSDAEMLAAMPQAQRIDVPAALARASGLDQEPFGGDYRTGQSFMFVDPITQESLASPTPPPVSANAPDTANALNAPPPAQTAQDWMMANTPDYRSGGRVFGDLPQTDITSSTSLFSDRVRRLNPELIAIQPALGTVPGNLRSAAGLQNTSDMIIDAVRRRNAAKRPGTRDIAFYDRELVDDPKTGKRKMKNIRNENPGVAQVLNMLGYSPIESERLASSLFQMEMQRRSGRNINASKDYKERNKVFGPIERNRSKIEFNAPEAIDPKDGQTEIARMRPGQQMEGRDIVTRMRELSDPMAAMPFIGATAADGEAPKIENRTGQTNPVQIERALRDKERAFLAKNPDGNYDVDSWIKGAVKAQQGADSTNAKIAREMEERMKYLPPNALSSRLPRRA